MQLRPVFSTAALLLVIAVVAGWQFRAQPEATRVDIDADRFTTEGGFDVEDIALDIESLGVAARSPGPAPRAASTAELPPAELPLRERFDALDAAARRGDAAAACELGAALARCANLARFGPMVGDGERELRGLARDTDEERLESRIEFIALRGKLLDDARRDCAGAEALPALERARYFAIAARAGHVGSMVEYLGLNHIGASTLIRDPGLVTEFRRDAPGFFARALAAGDLGLLRAWHAASHAPDYAPLHEVLPPEWRTPGFTRALLQQLSDAQRRRYLRGYGDDDALAVSDAERAEAERVFAQYFAEGEVPGQSVEAPDELRWLRDALGTERFRCDELAD